MAGAGGGVEKITTEKSQIAEFFAFLELQNEEVRQKYQTWKYFPKPGGEIDTDPFFLTKTDKTAKNKNVLIFTVI